MKPEYIEIGNFDEENYVYAYCGCSSTDYAIKWPRIKDGKVHSYTCTCEKCGTKVGVISKSYDSEVCNELNKLQSDVKNDVLNKIRTEIEQEYNRLFASKTNERFELGECLGLKMSLKIIDKYKGDEEK